MFDFVKNTSRPLDTFELNYNQIEENKTNIGALDQAINREEKKLMQMNKEFE